MTVAVVAEAPVMIAEVVGKLAGVAEGVGASVKIAALWLADDFQVYPESEIVFPLQSSLLVGRERSSQECPRICRSNH